MPKPPPEEATFTFSNALKFPRLLPEGQLPRVYIEWRGLKLANPPQLDDVGEHKAIPVSRKWREGNVVFVKAIHPEENRTCDFSVLRVRKGKEGNIAVLRIADGWPNAAESNALVLVRVVDGEKLHTLDIGEFLRALEMINTAPFRDENLEEIFGSIHDINSAEFRAIDQTTKSLVQEELPHYCFYCEAQIKPADNFCASCGNSLVAPKCPFCGELVSTTKDKRIFYHAENGHYPWHYTWDERCQHCHHHFSSTQTIASGHHLFFSGISPEELQKMAEAGADTYEGKVEIKITAGESIHTAFDDWDYRPTINIKITRQARANVESDGALLKEESISMTKEEFEAIKTQLEGPLAVLFQRKAWSRDTT